jgi:hypothetical protein
MEIPEDIPRDTIDGVEYLRLPPLGHKGLSFCAGCEFYKPGKWNFECKRAVAWLEKHPGRNLPGKGGYQHRAFVLPEKYPEWAVKWVEQRMGGTDGEE